MSRTDKSSIKQKHRGFKRDIIQDSMTGDGVAPKEN